MPEENKKQNIVKFEIDEKQNQRLERLFDLYDQKEIIRSQVIEKILDIIILKT